MRGTKLLKILIICLFIFSLFTVCYAQENLKIVSGVVSDYGIFEVDISDYNLPSPVYYTYLEDGRDFILVQFNKFHAGDSIVFFIKDEKTIVKVHINGIEYAVNGVLLTPKRMPVAQIE